MKILTDKIYSIILAELQPVIDEKGFTEKDGVFANAEGAFKIEHDEEKKLLKLYFAPVEDGEIKEYKEASGFLFEDEENERDAASAGMDFADTLKILVGIKKGRYQTGNIAIPKASGSKTPSIDDLTAKILTIYPEFKPAYQEHVAKYNSFLYIDFYKEFIVPKAREVMAKGNKKQVDKLMSLLSDMYCDGDRSVGNVVVGVILTGASEFDREKANAILEALNEYKFLKTAFQYYFDMAVKNKKVRQMFSAS